MAFLHMKFTRKHSAERVNQIIEYLHGKGKTVHQLSRKFGICRRSMDAYLSHLLGENGGEKRIYVAKWIEVKGGNIHFSQVYKAGNKKDAPRPPRVANAVLAKRYRDGKVKAEVEFVQEVKRRAGPIVVPPHDPLMSAFFGIAA
jgi:hypothetical protein